jgi:putative Mg2+ transporter-C (MgtC) family protein
VTVIGLCFGGGQLILGACATVLGVVTLWLLKRVDASIPHERRARVVIVCEAACDVLRDFPALVAGRRCRSHFVRQEQAGHGQPVEYEFRISWRGPKGGDMAIELLALVGSRYQVRIFDLTSEDTG